MRLRTPQAGRWLIIAERALSSSRVLFQQDEFRGSVNRSYYVLYQLATALSVEHGDLFPNGWNNPTHDQLPNLILNNRLLSLPERRQLAEALNHLRSRREDADYRPGRTVDKQEALSCLLQAIGIFALVEIED